LVFALFGTSRVDPFGIGAFAERTRQIPDEPTVFSPVNTSERASDQLLAPFSISSLTKSLNRFLNRNGPWAALDSVLLFNDHGDGEAEINSGTAVTPAPSFLLLRVVRREDDGCETDRHAGFKEEDVPGITQGQVGRSIEKPTMSVLETRRAPIRYACRHVLKLQVCESYGNISPKESHMSTNAPESKDQNKAAESKKPELTEAQLAAIAGGFSPVGGPVHVGPPPITDPIVPPQKGSPVA
jgi:hypothetical protein